MVCPSGTGPPGGPSSRGPASRAPNGSAVLRLLRVVRRDGREFPRRLVVREHLDAADVALFAGERGTEEGLDELRRLFLGVHAGADGHDVGVVVLAAQRGGLLAPGEHGAYAGDLVRGDLLAVAGAADDDAERARVRHGALGGAEAERRVVVLGVVDV